MSILDPRLLISEEGRRDDGRHEVEFTGYFLRVYCDGEQVAAVSMEGLRAAIAESVRRWILIDELVA